MVRLDDLQAMIAELFPRELPGGELSLLSPLEVADGTLYICLQLITRDGDVIVNVNEQEVALGRFEAHALARWQAYIEGTLRAAPEIVAALGGLDAVLPWDVFSFSQVLDDPALQTADAFAAKLRDPAQLAAWIEQFERDGWRAELEPCGLADHVEQVRALLRPSVRLQLEPIEAEDDDPMPALGCSRLGGDPDLPPGLTWPSVEGEPLVFLAQLDLAELAAYEAAAELPREGLLSLFYAPIPPDGYRLEHPVYVRVFDRHMLERRRAPEPRERLRPHTISFEDETLLPAVESIFHYEALLPSEPVREFYASLARGRAGTPPIDFAALSQLVVSRSMCDFERPAHRLLGHPASIQGDPYMDVEMCRGGWDGWEEGTEAAMAVRRRSLNWRLLLQVDAQQDGELLLNQDGGFFYVWMPADALAEHDWTRAKGCLQCH